jgi:hypothetical protein
MTSDLTLMARLLAYRDGRAHLRASHRQVAIKPDAYVLCPVALAGEDTTIHCLAYGRVGGPARVLCVPDPRKRDDQYRLFEQLGRDIEAYFDRCRAAGSYPQLWVSSSAAASHLDTLADRLRYNQLNPRVRRFGELLSFPTGRLPIAGQQALMTATGALKLHWATGQQEGEDEHLNALLTWIDPPSGAPVLQAVAAAELQPMGVKTDPEFDRDTLEPLVTAYNRAVRDKAPSPELRARAAAIQHALEPVALAIYAATQRAIALLSSAGLPPLPDLADMEARDADEFESFMRARDQGWRLTLRDGPKAAAFGLTAREEARENVEAAILLGDRVARAEGRLSGRVVVGTVDSPVRERVGSHQFEYRFELCTEQRVLHVRRRDELCLVDDPRLRVMVEDVHRQGSSTRLRLRIIAGQQAVGLPVSGASLELVKGVPKWKDVWRSRKHLSTVLASMPWTHRNDGPPPSTPGRMPAPVDLLVAVEGLR